MTFQLCLPGKDNISGEKKKEKPRQKHKKRIVHIILISVKEMINTCQVCHHPCQKNGLEIKNKVHSKQLRSFYLSLFSNIWILVK